MESSPPSHAEGHLGALWGRPLALSEATHQYTSFFTIHLHRRGESLCAFDLRISFHALSSKISCPSNRIVVGWLNPFFPGLLRRGAKCRYTNGQSAALIFFRILKSSLSLVSHLDSLSRTKILVSNSSRCPQYCKRMLVVILRCLWEPMLLHFRLHLFECFPFLLEEIPDLGFVLTPDVVGKTTSGSSSWIGG